jgi:hypothetical protein
MDDPPLKKLCSEMSLVMVAPDSSKKSTSKFATQVQLGNIFTKGLAKHAFQRLQNMLMGW